MPLCLLYIVCDSSSGYVFACVLYVICLLYSHLTSVSLIFIPQTESVSTCASGGNSKPEITKSTHCF